MNTLEQHQQFGSGVFIVNFEYIILLPLFLILF